MFNKKNKQCEKDKINNLEYRLDLLNKRIALLENEPSYFKMGDALPENSYLGIALKNLKAIIDYLDIEIKWEWKDDPSFPPVKQKQIRVWKAEKKQKLQNPPLKKKENDKHFCKD